MSTTLLENPSFDTGFAPRDGEPRYPSLWKVCVGAWYPGLGVQGSKLFEWAGRRRDGTLTNMAAGSDWVTGKRGLALDFDGTDDEVDIPDYGTLEDWTLCFWLNPDNWTPGEIQTFYVDDASQGGEVGFRLRDESNQNQMEVGGGTNIGAHLIRDVSGETGWHFVCFTQKRSSNTRRGYWDGSEYASSTNSGFGNLTGSQATLGNNPGTSRNFAGQIDDIRIYDRALTPAEVFLLSLRPGIAYELAETTPLRVAATTQVVPIHQMVNSGLFSNAGI